MANAWSSHWLFIEVFHTVTLTPRHVTSECFTLIHVSPFQSAVCQKCVCARDFTVIAFCIPPACVCVCVSSPRLDAAHLVSCLTLERTWKSKGARQCNTARSYRWLSMGGVHTVSSTVHCCCNATQWHLKCYCRLLSTVKERTKRRSAWLWMFKILIWSKSLLQSTHGRSLQSCWHLTGMCNICLWADKWMLIQWADAKLAVSIGLASITASVTASQLKKSHCISFSLVLFSL